MRLVGMMPVRNEAWVIGLSLRVALQWCDAVIVFDHASTDSTPDIVKAVMGEAGPGRVLYIREDSPQWDEMIHRQWMLEAARKIGATHLAIIDADEILTGNLLPPCSVSSGGLPRIDFAVSNTPPGCILELPGYNLRNGFNQYHSNGIWGNRWFSTAFADAADLWWSGDKFHSREPGPRKLASYRPIQQGQGGVMHLWGASERRLIAKHALYKVTERLRWPDKPIDGIDWQYSLAIKGTKSTASYGTPETWSYSTVPESWWAPYAPWMKYLDLDAEPWQKAEVRRLVAVHGREAFSGLDLFNVI